MPHEYSRPGIYSSATIERDEAYVGRVAASIIAFDHSSCVRTMETPALEPSSRGFTTIGKSSDPGKSGSDPLERSKTSHAGVGRPSAAISFLLMCLSIESTQPR